MHLGDGGDGDFGWQHRVEHMVIAQIGMGEDIVANALGIAQAAAVADHQPGFGAQDREVVADGFGVGGANADIDEADAGAAFADEVVGGHLVAAPGGI